MKRIFYLFSAFACLSLSAQGAVGDTTWVQANVDSLSWYGDYDSTVTFPAPGTTYRNIYMVFTLGKYACPAGSSWCGDWDYTVQNFLMTPGGDTLELGRLITPYANAGAPRTPWAWTQRYVYDVTEYASKLQGSATMRIHYSGYSGGFMGNIKFAFVEGTPERNVVSMERLWNGSYTYGGTPDINTNFPDVSKTAPAGTASSVLKFTVTGHGSDANYCCEFLSKNYDVKVNSTTVATTPIWKTCGSNQLYPQSGTWLYDRANWCPGERTNSNYHVLTGVTPGTPYNLGLAFQSYTGSGSLGSYTTEAQLFNYGPVNNAKDAAIVEIISPTNNENNFRENPTCSKPTIRIRNRGTAPITAMTIEYGIKDSTMQSYSWTGTIASLTETNIVLPALTNLANIAGVSGLYDFVATIKDVNGSADGDASNDVMRSQFVSAPKWPSKFQVVFKTNNEESTPGSGISETKWEIFDVNETVVASRTGVATSSTFTDTLQLPTGCYRLQITDGSCDGLNWWANAGTGITSGSFTVKKVATPASSITMNGYYYSGQYNNDFGCGYAQYFYTVSTLGVDDVTGSGVGISTFPNPAGKTVTVELSGMANISGTLSVLDVVGRTVITQPCTTATKQIALDGLNNGVYTVVFTDEQGKKMQTRLTIAK